MKFKLIHWKCFITQSTKFHLHMICFILHDKRGETQRRQIMTHVFRWGHISIIHLVMSHFLNENSVEIIRMKILLDHWRISLVMIDSLLSHWMMKIFDSLIYDDEIQFVETFFDMKNIVFHLTLTFVPFLLHSNFTEERKQEDSSFC